MWSMHIWLPDLHLQHTGGGVQQLCMPAYERNSCFFDCALSMCMVLVSVEGRPGSAEYSGLPPFAKSMLLFAAKWMNLCQDAGGDGKDAAGRSLLQERNQLREHVCTTYIMGEGSEGTYGSVVCMIGALFHQHSDARSTQVLEMCRRFGIEEAFTMCR